MNASKFDAIVKNRAQEKVEARVIKFRSEIHEAFKHLFENTGICVQDHYYNFLTDSEVVRQCFNNCVRTREKQYQNTWPKELWEHEQKAVADQLLSIMDEMQKALVAPAPSEGGARPDADAAEAMKGGVK